MNVLFSDKHSERLAQLGNTASRDVLNKGKAAQDQNFWEKVPEDFLLPGKFGELFFIADVDVIAAQDGIIDSSKINPHGWKKLRQIWRGIYAENKACLSRFTLSGTHDFDFYSFCNEKLEPLPAQVFGKPPNVVGYVVAEIKIICIMFYSGPVTSRERSL